MAVSTSWQGKPWDVVIDFIGMHPELTKDVLTELHPNGLRHFIHISTISAYEPNLDGSGSMGAGRDPSVPHVVEEVTALQGQLYLSSPLCVPSIHWSMLIVGGADGRICSTSVLTTRFD